VECSFNKTRAMLCWVLFFTPQTLHSEHRYQRVTARCTSFLCLAMQCNTDGAVPPSFLVKYFIYFDWACVSDWYASIVKLQSVATSICVPAKWVLTKFNTPAFYKNVSTISFFYIGKYMTLHRKLHETTCCCELVKCVFFCVWFRASSIYINNCPTRCNTKQSIYYSASSLYMFGMSTTPIIRSTQNCNYSLRYCAATSFQRGLAWPRWGELAAQTI